MDNKKQAFHGSDLESIEAIYGIKKEEIIPFGGNVNPLGISPLLKRSMGHHIEAICEYPDRDYKTLRHTLSIYTNQPMEHIMVGNGATELISLTFQQLRPQNALLLAPTYSEYMREISLVGGSYKEFFLLEEDDFRVNMSALKAALTKDVDLFAFCNPNNPTSSALTKDEIKEILTHCKSNDIFVLIDETYVEFAPSMEDITATSLLSDFDNLMILRGTSKFFAAPGLRLGYGLCGNVDFLQQLSEIKNPWTINTLAALAGEAMFLDTDYIKTTKDFICSQRDLISNRLRNSTKWKSYPAYANFFLLKRLDDATSFDIFERCIQKGFMVRDCSSFHGLQGEFIRFCIRKEDENERLLDLILE